MSSTTASASQTASSSATQSAQANRAGQSGARRASEPGADNSLFANLLFLLADAQEQPLPELGADVGSGAEEGDALLAGEDNPLAALAGWPGSPVPGEPGDAAAEHTPAGAADEKDLAMQTVDEPAPEMDMATDRAAHESPQGVAGNTQRSQAALKGLSATAQAQAQPLKTGATAKAANGAVQPMDGNGMVWRRTSGGGTEGMPVTGTAHLAGVRSTVTLNDRFGHLAGQVLNPAVSREAVAVGVAPVQVSGNAQVTTGTATAAAGVGASDASLAAGSASGTDAGGGDHPNDAHTAEQDSQGAEAFEASSEAEGQQISHWGTQNLRHASLRVGQGGQDAIDIQLSVKGQEVQVDFRTDNADARASLENNADQSLADMLQRSGIQLAGVSVGAQGQGSDRRASSDETTAQRVGRASQRVTDTPVPPGPTRTAPLRPDGSRPLDLFV